MPSPMVADVRAADGGSGHADRIALRRAAEEFEAAFLGQLLGGMTQGLAGDGPLGGGNDPFAAMLRDEYGRLIARGGGIGVADAVMRQLLRLQERS